MFDCRGIPISGKMKVISNFRSFDPFLVDFEVIQVSEQVSSHSVSPELSQNFPNFRLISE